MKESLTSQQLLFIITFTFGVLKFIFLMFGCDYKIKHPFELLVSKQLIDKWRLVFDRPRKYIGDYIFVSVVCILNWSSIVLCYLCLMYQVWYWFIIVCKLP